MRSHRNKNKNELQDDINVFQNDMWLPQRYSINDKFYINQMSSTLSSFPES